MSLELNGMVYYSFLDFDKQTEQEEDSDSDGHCLSTFLAFLWAIDATQKEVEISVLKSGTGLGLAVTEVGFTSTSLLVFPSEKENPV